MKRHRQDFLDANEVVVPEETDTHIYGLFGPYRCLSNFHMHPVTVDGLTFKCSEAAYMAQKTDDPAQKLYLTTLGAKEAKAAGQKVTLRPDWEEVKVEAMFKVLTAKFGQDPESEGVLLSTGNKVIEETNWWGDKFWGVCGGEGLNQLGQTLMRVRNELRRADSV